MVNYIVILSTFLCCVFFVPNFHISEWFHLSSPNFGKKIEIGKILDIHIWDHLKMFNKININIQRIILAKL